MKNIFDYLLLMNKEKESVGGQAVIEGVMMRSKDWFAVAVRRADNSIVLWDRPWQPLTNKYKFLKWPFFRGGLVLVESMINGFQALKFSAEQAEEDIPDDLKQNKKENINNLAGKQNSQYIDDKNKIEDEKSKKEDKINFVVPLVVGLILAMLIFKGVPHLSAYLIGKISGFNTNMNSIWFHITDGTIKLLLFIGYIFFISKLKDIQRVFMYHGAEHKSIFAYENTGILKTSEAQKYSRLHPRCGTAFLIVVILISIILYTLTLPFIPPLTSITWLNHVLWIIIKIFLLMPIAGIAYEFNRFAGKHIENSFFKTLSFPGLMMQKLTTKEPLPDQIEIALVALTTVLNPKKDRNDINLINRYKNFDEFININGLQT